MRVSHSPGEVFGRLTLTSRLPKQHPKQQQRWLCTCVCGKVIEAYQGNIVSGKTSSCGCFRKEVVAELGKRTGSVNGGSTRTHGMRDAPEYRIWSLMRNRVNNSGSEDYKNYGGRGITLDPGWNSFEKFYADMGPRPSPEHSIDRKDNSKGYEPGNCHWATSTEQNRNRRDNVLITFNGKTQCVSAWAEELKLDAKLIYSRLSSGWDSDRALTEPAKRR